MLRHFRTGSGLRAQRGFSLIELSIAVLLALFLLGGLVTLVTGTRRSNGTQNAVSQLQDNERVAMTLINYVVQKAGYFPNPVNQTLNSFLAETMSGVGLAQGQVVGGTYSATAPGDVFMARFLTPPSDTAGAVISCAGQSNTTATTGIWYTNVFQVAQVNNVWWLQCLTRTSGAGTVTTVNLVPNVTNISVLYGVGNTAAGDDYSVVQYLNASQMNANATNWLNVTAVKVTLTFLVPQYQTTGGQMSTATQTFQRVIPVMGRAGVDT